MKITLEHDEKVEELGCYCLVCGRNLGSCVYLPELSTWNHVDFIPVCNKCFVKNGLKMIESSKIQSPYNSV